MITLATGLPGNAKTLFMLWYIAAKAKKENREVFYHNIKGLNGPAVGNWQEFEPEKWMFLPDGCIVVMDECQEVFPRKPNGAQLPAHYEELAKHRHKGLDIFIITQHPTLIDNFVRRLVGQHFHSVRKFGLQRATIYEWSKCEPAPENVSSQKNAVTHKFKFPKEVYTWYKSAEVHTVKRAIPMKLVLACLFVVGVIAGGAYTFYRYKHRYDKPSPGELAKSGPGAAPGGAPGVARGGFASDAAKFDPLEDAKEYAWKQTPRVAGLAATAPKYDQMTQPTHVPVPAMCIQKGSVGVGKEVSCKCFSQQATPLDVPFTMCLEFARDGYFREFDADKDKQDSTRSDSSQKVLDRVADAPLPDHQGVSGSHLVVIPGTPMGPQRTDTSPGLNEVIQDGPPNNRATRAAAGAAVAG